VSDTANSASIAGAIAYQPPVRQLRIMVQHRHQVRGQGNIGFNSRDAGGFGVQKPGDGIFRHFAPRAAMPVNPHAGLLGP
jgi:hypothetical protein